MNEIFIKAIQVVLLAFITGAIIKIVDVIIDNPKKKNLFFKKADLVLGLLYGFLIALMVSKFNEIAPLWLGVVLGVIFTFKMDGLGHMMSIPVMVISIHLLRQFSVNVFWLVFFALLCIIEEIVNDRIDKYLTDKKRKSKNKILKFFKYRPFVEIGALIYSINLMNFFPLIAIVFFDIGYVMITRKFEK